MKLSPPEVAALEVIDCAGKCTEQSSENQDYINRQVASLESSRVHVLEQMLGGPYLALSPHHYDLLSDGINSCRHNKDRRRIVEGNSQCSVGIGSQVFYDFRNM